MATVHKEFIVQVPPEHAWAAIRDVGAVHSRLAQQFVVDTRAEGDSRLVTFANGVVVRERIITIDDARRRMAYSVVEWRATHHNASFQVIAEAADRSRIVWTADVLPDDLGEVVDGLMEQGAAAIKQTLEATAPRATAGASSTGV